MSEIQNVFQSQCKNLAKTKKTTVKERILLLKKMKQLLYEKTNEIYNVCYKDYKKGEMEVDLAEIMPVISEINHTIRKLKKWMKPKKVSSTMTMFGTKARIYYEPKGVVLIISPWNYPINLTLGPLVSAVAAGNNVIVKPSELTPNISTFLKNFIEEIFAKNHVGVFEGGVEVSTKLLDLPFHHIFFTGSPQVGKIVMEKAAKNLATVTLELGGKSPVIVTDSAHMKKSAESIIWGKLTNNGQTCIAPDYIFVSKDKKQELIDALKNTASKFYGENIEKNKDYCRIVNKRHFERLQSLIDETGKIEYGGQKNDADNFMEPVILSEITPEHAIMKNEIFGPILPVLEYDSMNDVLEHINNNHKPLAIYIFGKNKKEINQIIDNTTAGGTVVNNTMIQYSHANLPFGGVNNSGIGSAHGIYGFKAFSHERSVLHQSTLFNMSRLFLPPYSETKRKILKLTMKYFT